MIIKHLKSIIYGLLIALPFCMSSPAFSVDGNPVLVPVAVVDLNVSSDVETMLASANNTIIISNIGAESDLVNEAGLMAALADVTQFFEPGDNITTAYGTVPPTSPSPGQFFGDTDEDTDGSLLFCFSPGNWKDVGMGPDKDKIIEGDSSWEIIDSGTGYADCDIDGILRTRINGDGLDVNGTVVCDGVEVDATANPHIRFLGAPPGTDKFNGAIYMPYIGGGDGAENVDILIKSQEGGANTTQMQYDESETAWKIPTGKNLVLAGGYVVGKAKRGSLITANTTLTTTDLHSMVYTVNATCKVTLDAAADVGYDWVSGFRIRGAVTLTLEIDNANKFDLHGTVLDAGDTIDSPGNAGDFIFLISTTDTDGSGTDGYETWGYAESSWIDGGAS